MPKVKLETTQNVYLDLEVASIGERVVATIIDRIFLLLYFWLALWLAGVFDLDNEVSQGYYMSVVLFSIPIFFFAFVIEVLTNGQSLGKKFMKMRVIKIDGSLPSIGDYLLRWMLRLIDLYLLVILAAIIDTQSVTQILSGFGVIPLCGLLFMSFTPKNQRLGDLAANTIVIRKGKQVSLEDTVLPLLKMKYKPRFLNALELNDKDVRIIKEVIDNSVAGQNDGLVKKLAIKAKEVLNIKTDLPPRKFLFTLMKDYNYLAMQESQNNKLH